MWCSNLSLYAYVLSWWKTALCKLVWFYKVSIKQVINSLSEMFSLLHGLICIWLFLALSFYMTNSVSTLSFIIFQSYSLINYNLISKAANTLISSFKSKLCFSVLFNITGEGWRSGLRVGTPERKGYIYMWLIKLRPHCITTSQHVSSCLGLWDSASAWR